MAQRRELTDQQTSIEPFGRTSADDEVHPPWIEYPGVPPWDFFWREAGEPWRVHVWEPHFNSLDEAGQSDYLDRWKVPQEWRDGNFDPSLRNFWEHVDDPE